MFSPQSLNHFFRVLAEKGGNRIEHFAISGINIHQDSVPSLVSAVDKLTVLKRLILNENPSLGGGPISQIIRALKKHNKIEELDLSKTGVANDHGCMQLLGELIK